MGYIDPSKIPDKADLMTAREVADFLHHDSHTPTASYGTTGGDVTLVGVKLKLEELRRRGKHAITLDFFKRTFEDYGVNIRGMRLIANEIVYYLQRQQFQH